MLKKVLMLSGAVALIAAVLFTGARAGSTLPARAPQLEGAIAYAAGGQLWIWRNGPAQLTRANERDGSPALSPDGRIVAFVRFDDSFSDVLVAPAGGGPAVFLTNNRPAAETGSKPYVDEAVWALAPTWSPDGSRIAFASDAGTDAPVLWVMSAQGEGARRFNTEPPAPPVERPTWSPSGAEIAATSYGSGKPEIWSLDLNTGIWREIAAPAGGAYDPAWSPDGRWLAYTARSGRSHDIWVVPADGSAGPVQVTRHGRARGAAWSPSGGQIAFLGERDHHFEIHVIGISTGTGAVEAGSAEQVTDNVRADAASGLTWSR